MRRLVGVGLGLVLGLAGAACSRPESTEVEVDVRSVGLDSASHAPVVLLQDKDRRTGLPIWIGPAEAQAIAMELEGVRPPRPMTHDLMKDLLVQSGVEVRRVVIGKIEDRTYFARIHLRAGRGDVEVDSRPSDAIALAVRLEKPIFVARALMAGETAIDIEQAFGAESVDARGLTVQSLSAELAEVLEIHSASGVLVSGVAEGVQGVRRGDIVTAVNGVEVRGPGHFAQTIASLGAKIARLRVERDGRRFEVDLLAR